MKRLILSYSLKALLLLTLFLASGRDLYSQEQERIVQLSGLVMSVDTTQSIFGVHIFDAVRGRGTVSDYRGWFSKAFYAGDTIIFSAVGFKNRSIIVPSSEGDRFTIVVTLEEEITQLADVEINPFPSEELFKEAFLAMNLNEDQQNVLNSYDPEFVQRLVRTMPLEGSSEMNYRYLMDQQFNNLNTGPRTNPLLNPFAWAQFIKTLKKKK
ncbi:MAG: hypothetical protein ACJAS3_000023 [Roseivirga sp.]